MKFHIISSADWEFLRRSVRDLFPAEHRSGSLPFVTDIASGVSAPVMVVPEEHRWITYGDDDTSQSIALAYLNAKLLRKKYDTGINPAFARAYIGANLLIRGGDGGGALLPGSSWSMRRCLDESCPERCRFNLSVYAENPYLMERISVSCMRGEADIRGYSPEKDDPHLALYDRDPIGTFLYFLDWDDLGMRTASREFRDGLVESLRTILSSSVLADFN